MRLTLVIPSLNCGGAERVMSIMANHWAAQGGSVHLVTYDDGGERPYYPLDPWVELRPLGLSSTKKSLVAEGGLFWKRLRSLRREIRASKPEAVISFMESTNVLCILATLGTGIPVMVAERNDPEKKDTVKQIWKLLRRWTYPLARSVVVQTERMGDYFRPRLDGKIDVIPNPVLLPESDESVDPGHDVDSRTIVSFGRLYPQKGYDLLLQAFARIHEKFPEWKLAIFGIGKDRDQLLSLVSDLGIGGKVKFPGRTNHPYAVLKRAGLYVSSSRYEGFPNALCEAMASGLPVVATDCPTGPREIITDGEDGLLVPPEDIDALAAAMNRMMSDEAMRHRIGGNAGKITERFGIDSVMGQWEAVLKTRCGVSA